MSPIILVGAGLLVLGLGVALGYWLSSLSQKRAEAQAADIQKELDEYRRHVTEHFSETAQHFKALGQQYQSLYKHMAHGADALCDPAQSDGLLEFPAGDTAALTTSAEATATPPESIKDYAPAEAEDSSERKAKAADVVETKVDKKAKPEAADEPLADEEIAEAIGKPELDEAKRTVH